MKLDDRLAKLRAAALLVREQYNAQQEAFEDAEDAAFALIGTVLDMFPKRVKRKIAVRVYDAFGHE